ncbi:hypothetical protein ACF05L_22030 [Streptomyces bobili]
MLVIEADVSFWDSLVLDRIDGLSGEAVTAVFGNYLLGTPI